jgi:type III restriction enzyme
LQKSYLGKVKMIYIDPPYNTGNDFIYPDNRKLDEREDIKLFVKLPGWFVIDTPVGKYNPDWAIVKHHDQTLYLVRETKATRDFLQLRTIEAEKVRCGKKHFDVLGVPFAVSVTADDV